MGSGIRKINPTSIKASYMQLYIRVGLNPDLKKDEIEKNEL